VGPKRLVPPALGVRDLPRVDLLLLSHAHHDHYDLPTLRRLPKEVPVVLARDTTEFLEDVGFEQVQELDWHQTAEVKGVHIEAVPVRHWGRRYLWDKNRGYNGLLLTKNGRSILFGGDTAHTDRLPAAVQGRPIDLAILPIGAYNPYIHNHADPEQAWDLANRMGARYLAPMHWRTFRLSRERPFEPYERLASAANGSRHRIALHQIGETWRLPG
jgi:L-ascorbate metabolism protein UlaG (beta-lactamase superfamily)